MNTSRFESLQRGGAASGGVDHLVVTHNDRCDESSSFAYPAYRLTVLHSWRFVKTCGRSPIYVVLESSLGESVDAI